MKHFVLVLMAAATMCTQAVAQNRVKSISANSTTLNVSALQDEAQTVQLNRTLYAGYNTLCLPLSLSADQLKAAALDIQVERMVSIRQEGNTLVLYFVPCTDEGLQAGCPYLIYSPTTQTLRVRNTESLGFSNELKLVRMNDGVGNVVSFGSSWNSVEKMGRYGIPAKQDVTPLESVLVRTEGDKTFLPTRCGFVWEEQSPSATKLEIRHISKSEVTAILQVSAEEGSVDVYDLNGKLVRSGVKGSQTKKLPRGVYVIGGEKVVVK